MFYIVSRNVNWCNHYGKQHRQSSKKLKLELPYDPATYFWASLQAQLVKNPPAMQEIWVQSLGWEDPLETGKATHPSILA